MPAKNISVYLDGYPFDCRPRNSDWSYVERKIPRVNEWAPEIRFVHQRSFMVTIRANAKAIRAALGRRIGVPFDALSANTAYLDQEELSRSGCNVVFSHREYPLNSGATPVVWMSAIVDPEMSRSYFPSRQAELAEDAAVKETLFHKAAVVQVCSDAEAKRHAKTFPNIADRFFAIPLFGPHLRSAPESVLEKHNHDGKVNLLFVGNASKRKGLQEVVDAYSSLPSGLRRSTSFTVVSHFDRGTVSIPSDSGIEVYRGLPQAKVMKLMNAAHILLNPAHFESYGMVFLEAMSQGALCIGPNWEVQRELFDGGRAGVNVRCDVDLLRTAISRSIEDRVHRSALASSGWRRFKQLYAPEVVARRYAELFRKVTGGGSALDVSGRHIW